MNQRSLHIRRLTCSAMCLALALVLPFLTGQIPEIGSKLCPMHIPVLLCGFLCGWSYGLGVGLIAPLLRNLIFGMPPIYTAIAMAFELAAYGAFSGLIYHLLPRKNWAVYVSLLAAMVLGRIVWGAAQFVILGLRGSAFSFTAFINGAILSAIPGIIVQIVLIPLIVMVLKRAKLMFN